MNACKIALMGECMIELQELESGTVQQTFGGDTLNTAIYMARVARDLPVRVDYITALGTDSFSQAMMRFWEKEHVGSSLVQRIEGARPGLYYIQLDETGERSFHYWRGEAAVRSCFEHPESDTILQKISEYDAFYLSGISLAVLYPQSLEKLLARMRELKQEGARIYFDGNYRPLLWRSKERAVRIYRQVFSLAHTVLLNIEEGATLLGRSNADELHHALQDFGVQESVIRNEAAPCSVFHHNKMHIIEAKKVPNVVDTTAAGDSFSAAYLLARTFGAPIPDAVRFAHDLAAYVISHKGAIAPLAGTPTLSDALLPGRNTEECGTI